MRVVVAALNVTLRALDGDKFTINNLNQYGGTSAEHLGRIYLPWVQYNVARIQNARTLHEGGKERRNPSGST